MGGNMENYVYKINESYEIIENARVKVYGISVFNIDLLSDKDPLEEIKGITSERSYIDEILKFVCKFKPSPIHLYDVICDILAR